ncbi:MAG: response regulator transcription factor [Bryobacteraceae bacterium]|nr:response regulator transcription factor [Bryobacteraceae bacterium]
MRRTTVLVADDHGVVRKGLLFLLATDASIEVVGEACDGRQAVAEAERLNPDIAILDIAMPLLSGIDAAAQITRRNPRTGVIMLSMYSDEEFIIRALSAGAKGYLLKDSADPDLVRAVRTVADGRPFFSPAVAQTLLDDYMRLLQQSGLQDSYDLLTDREKEVLQLLAAGKTNKEAAAVLNLGVSTVETHRTNLMQKLNLHNTAEIVLYAVRKRLIP